MAYRSTGDVSLSPPRSPRLRVRQAPVGIGSREDAKVSEDSFRKGGGRAALLFLWSVVRGSAREAATSGSFSDP